MKLITQVLLPPLYILYVGSDSGDPRSEVRNGIIHHPQPGSSFMSDVKFHKSSRRHQTGTTRLTPGKAEGKRLSPTRLVASNYARKDFSLNLVLPVPEFAFP